MHYTRNCSITKIPFRIVDEIVAVPTLFKNEIDFTSLIDSHIYQIPLILKGTYFQYGMFNFQDDKETKKSIFEINKLIDQTNTYGWLDLNEYCRTSFIQVNGEKCIFDFFAIHKEVYDEILNSHFVLVDDDLLNYSEFKALFIENFKDFNYVDRYIAGEEIEDYEIDNIATIEFIKNFMFRIGVSVQPSFYVKEYQKEPYEIISRATAKILSKT